MTLKYNHTHRKKYFYNAYLNEHPIIMAKEYTNSTRNKNYLSTH